MQFLKLNKTMSISILITIITNCEVELIFVMRVVYSEIKHLLCV